MPPSGKTRIHGCTVHISGGGQLCKNRVSRKGFMTRKLCDTFHGEEESADYLRRKRNEEEVDEGVETATLTCKNGFGRDHKIMFLKKSIFVPTL
ncbi:unnamed protein product [Prunus armeniaca]|uniref:Uncharacterized protein n=1 Tax=Prunus armeniaca TaxID=36596 RepID=A0A6J5UM45_PRUAR|nr:unnamed protein product [Prunus armeniaca]